MIISNEGEESDQLVLSPYQESGKVDYFRLLFLLSSSPLSDTQDVSPTDTSFSHRREKSTYWNVFSDFEGFGVDEVNI